MWPQKWGRLWAGCVGGSARSRLWLCALRGCLSWFWLLCCHACIVSVCVVLECLIGWFWCSIGPCLMSLSLPSTWLKFSLGSCMYSMPLGSRGRLLLVCRLSSVGVWHSWQDRKGRTKETSCTGMSSWFFCEEQQGMQSLRNGWRRCASAATIQVLCYLAFYDSDLILDPYSDPSLPICGRRVAL